jgi:hypothetical protein
MGAGVVGCNQLWGPGQGTLLDALCVFVVLDLCV